MISTAEFIQHCVVLRRRTQHAAQIKSRHDALRCRTQMCVYSKQHVISICSVLCLKLRLHYIRRCTLTYGDVVIEHVDFYGSVHTDCVAARRRTQHNARFVRHVALRCRDDGRQGNKLRQVANNFSICSVLL